MRRRAIWTALGVSALAYALVVGRYIALLASIPTFIAWAVVIVPVMVGSGIVLMWKRPDNRIGELLALTGLVFFVVPTTLEIPTVARYEASGAANWMWAPIAAVLLLNGVGTVLVCDLVVRLPDGRYRFDRERRLVRWSLIALPATTLLLLSSPSAPSHSQAFPGLEDIPNPLAIEALTPFEGAFRALWGLSYIVFAGAVALQFLRYRSAGRRERKQLRWVLFAALISMAVGLLPFALEAVGVIDPMGHASVSAIVATLTMSVFPISVVIAVLEPPWIDVDNVIRQSMVYALLSFGILAAYAAVTASLGVAAGQRLDLEIAILLTVVATIAFQPARRRLQALADRLAFGERPTRYEAVTSFRESVDRAGGPAELIQDLAITIQQAVGLSWVTAKLSDGFEIEVGDPSGEPDLDVTIGTEEMQIGVLRCGPKPRGSIDAEDEALIRTLADHAGLALVNLALAGRIVNAAEAERRRIERNIHDGAQQELVALVARLGMARDAAETGDLDAGELTDLQDEARTILSDLRDLAQGIHPSVLTDGGIVAAVEARCAQLPVRVRIEALQDLRRRRFADHIEGAAYFFVSECIANVLKHADAASIEVALNQDATGLHLAVADDGCGFDAGAARRNGLAGLADRMQALGGTIRVQSANGHGSRVEAILPVSTQ